MSFRAYTSPSLLGVARCDGISMGFVCLLWLVAEPPTSDNLLSIA